MGGKRTITGAFIFVGIVVGTAAGSIAPLSALAGEPQRAELSDTRPAAEISSGTVTARVGMVASSSDPAMSAPLLEVLVNGTSAVRIEGVASGWETPQGTIEIQEIDPANDTPEVVFTSFSGGAHCCTQVHVASADKDGKWSDVEIGFFDGEGGSFVDLNGDGEAEFRTYDNAFLYAFDCYACSSAPLALYAVKAGKVVDVSRNPAFEPVHRAWLADMETRLAEATRDFSPGFFTGWIAEKAILGEGFEAWETMMTAYRGYADEGFESCPVAKPDCADNERRKLSYPDTLKVFLKQQGYLQG
ncbi:hypothetical protein C8N35_101449 [Breoghania corrubedonensis]|uniref:Uncharacterized protein n=1 Tax=Breoghania corrubedonensis TaxID=665038 RepID=A0A2T5VFB1_9HYPH|nr:hypothetical protein [Breoghania corrubedonensis]PTW62406.1 hypothetical protein C8N35_101449 [Breoghania corrubedonensis]